MSDYIIRVIDTETTGIDDDAELVEIGAVDVSVLRREIITASSDLIKPSKPIPATAMAIHHITEDHVWAKPPAEQVLPCYSGYSIYAAHNAAFDRRFVAKELGGKWICTLKCAYELIPDAPAYGNQVLRYHLGLYSPPNIAGAPHRALYDAYVTARLLIHLLSIDGVTPDRLVDISSRPRLLREVPFGKHKGKAWSELPARYFDWMRRQGDWDEDVNYTLTKETERRHG